MEHEFIAFTAGYVGLRLVIFAGIGVVFYSVLRRVTRPARQEQISSLDRRTRRH